MTTDLILQSPSERKLPEGWHFTEKYGEVYVSPGGTAWTVRQIGNELKSVSVPLTPAAIVKTPAIDRRKHALAAQRRYKVALSIRTLPILPLSVVRDSKEAVMAGVK